MLKNTTILLLLSLLSACSTFHVERELEISSEMEDLRPIQTRLFHTGDQTLLTRAAVDTLLELGFSNVKHEPSLGFVSASQSVDVADADRSVQIGAALLFFLIFRDAPPFSAGVDDHETLYATIVVMADKDKGNNIVRFTLQRVMYAANKRISESDNISESGIYSEFFSRMKEKIEAQSLVLRETSR